MEFVFQRAALCVVNSPTHVQFRPTKLTGPGRRHGATGRFALSRSGAQSGARARSLGSGEDACCALKEPRCSFFGGEGSYN